MKLTASEIKAMVAGYFRYKRQCPVIAFEASDKLKWADGEPADILVITESRMLYEIEVKISLSDLKHDKKQGKHSSFLNRPDYLPVHKFYFAVSEDLANKAQDICKDFFPYAGLLVVSKFPFNSAALDFGVSEYRSPKILNNSRVEVKAIIRLIKEQSGTVCRIARDKAVAESSLIKAQKESVELEKLLKLAGISN